MNATDTPAKAGWGWVIVVVLLGLPSAVFALAHLAASPGRLPETLDLVVRRQEQLFRLEGLIMSWSRLLCITTLALCGFLSLVVESALAEDKTVKVEKEWMGGSGKKKDNEAWKQAPPDMVIAGPKAWEKLWKAWQFEKELPKVDFEKDLILVVACAGPNSIRIDKLTLSEKGNLRFDWSHPDKGGPGFRCLILRVSRSGIKTVSGKEILKD